MKIKDSLILGKAIVIKGSTRQDLPEFFVDMGCWTGAEIGVYKGGFTKKLLEAGLEVYAIDPWKSYKINENQERMDFLYGHTKRELSKYDEQTCHIVRKASMEALNDFDDESLDFVYIDGNHSFPHVANDIFYWEKKVKRGGIVSGHDYLPLIPYGNNVCHVHMIVLAYTETFNIKNWYITDKNPNVSGDMRTPSWFWIKE